MSDILLRELRKGDITIWCRWLNDPGVFEAMNKGAWPNTEEDQSDYFDKLRKSDTDAQFAIVEYSGKSELVGTIGIHKIDWVHRRGDVSIVIGRKNCRGKGIGTSAIALIVQHAFDKMNLRKLTAGMWANNKGSIRAFERNGFVLEGRLKDSYYYKGQYVDELRYALFTFNWIRRP